VSSNLTKDDRLAIGSILILNILILLLVLGILVKLFI